MTEDGPKDRVYFDAILKKTSQDMKEREQAERERARKEAEGIRVGACRVCGGGLDPEDDPRVRPPVRSCGILYHHVPVAKETP